MISSVVTPKMEANLMMLGSVGTLSPLIHLETSDSWIFILMANSRCDISLSNNFLLRYLWNILPFLCVVFVCFYFSNGFHHFPVLSIFLTCHFFSFFCCLVNLARLLLFHLVKTSRQKTQNNSTQEKPCTSHLKNSTLLCTH